MSAIGYTPRITVEVDGGSLGIAAMPVVSAIPIAAANVEQSFSLPTGTKAFEVNARLNNPIHLAYAAGESDPGGNFILVPPGGTYNKDGLKVASLTLYFQCANPSEVVQITAWV